MENTENYYNLTKTLSHGATVYLLVGARGYGKTFALKERFMRRYMKYGERFIYVRRFAEDLELVKKVLFHDLFLVKGIAGKVETDKTSFIWVKGEGKEETREVIGYHIALSQQSKLKSSSYPDVTTVGFDEFLIDTESNDRYLKNEITMFLNLIDTIMRERDNCKVLLLANALSMTNPYFMYWGVNFAPNRSYWKGKEGLIYAEILESKDYTEQRKKTVFGRLIDGTKYAEYATENKFLLDDDTFILKKSGKLSYMFTMVNNEQYFGIWKNIATGLLFVSNDVDSHCPYVFSTDMRSHDEKTQIAFGVADTYIKTLVKYYKLGCLRFESLNIKNVVASYLATKIR